MANLFLPIPENVDIDDYAFRIRADNNVDLCGTSEGIMISADSMEDCEKFAKKLKNKIQKVMSK